MLKFHLNLHVHERVTSLAVSSLQTHNTAPCLFWGGSMIPFSPSLPPLLWHLTSPTPFQRSWGWFYRTPWGLTLMWWWGFMDDIAEAPKWGTRSSTSCQELTQQNMPPGGQEGCGLLFSTLKAAAWSQDPNTMGLRCSWCLGSQKWVTASNLMPCCSSLFILTFDLAICCISTRLTFELPSELLVLVLEKRFLSVVDLTGFYMYVSIKFEVFLELQHARQGEKAEVDWLLGAA